MPHGNSACMNVLIFCSSPPDKPVVSLGPYTNNHYNILHHNYILILSCTTACTPAHLAWLSLLRISKVPTTHTHTHTLIDGENGWMHMHTHQWHVDVSMKAVSPARFQRLTMKFIVSTLFLVTARGENKSNKYYCLKCRPDWEQFYVQALIKLSNVDF